MSDLAKEIPPTTPDVIRSPKYPGIRFEPVLHPSSTADQQAAAQASLQAFDAGNLRFDLIWNPELAVRLKQYKPQIFGIDTLSPGYDNNEPLSDGNVKLLWATLPDRPKEFSKLNAVYVVRGDLYGLDAPFLKEGFKRGSPIITQLAQQTDAMDAAELNRMTAEKFTPNVLAAVYFVRKALQSHGASKNPEAQSIRQKRKKMSRRDFLRIGGLVTGATVLGSTLFGTYRAPTGAATADTPQELSFYTKLADTLRPRLFKLDTINFRTALVMAKMEDAYDYLGIAPTLPGALVFGTAHLFEATQLMNDETYMNQTIRNGTQAMIEATQEVVAQLPEAGLTQEDVKAAILKAVQACDIIRLEDPGNAPFSPSLMETLRQRTHKIATFQSPRVRAALNSIDK